MINWLLANAVLLLHLAFILFVVAGGALVVWKPRLVWLHIPAVIWGALIELLGWFCPLTPLENHFLKLSGESGYEGGFIEHYLLPLIYPETLTPATQYAVGSFVLAINAVMYIWLWRRGTWKQNP